jgi:class 3 adenylate cyclase
MKSLIASTLFRSSEKQEENKLSLDVSNHSFRKMDSAEFNQMKRMSTNFFEESLLNENNRSTFDFSNDNNPTTYDLLHNACICMIDIVGFSSWCSNQIPNIIAKSMIEYNELICQTISDYNNLKKIELVGDCCMVIASSTFPDNCLNCIRFAVDLLNKIIDIQNIFKSKFIGIRIGIHLSDVIGVYIEDPNKYQLFGNDINICSRLEASTKSNTMHISEKTLMVVQDLCNSKCGPCSQCIKGDCIKQEYKGVGTKTSYIFYLKKEKSLLINFNHENEILFTNAIKCTKYDYDTDYEIVKLYMQSYQYICIYLNLIMYDKWEDCDNFLQNLMKIRNHNIVQHYILLFASTELIKKVNEKYPYTFNEFINVNNPRHVQECQNLYSKFKLSFKNKRGSLDLHIYEDKSYYIR